MSGPRDTLPSSNTKVLRGHKGPVYAVRFNGDGTYCLSCGGDKTVRLWNPRKRPDEEAAPGEDSPFLVHTYGEGVHGYEVMDVDVHPSNASFASCGRGKELIVWDVEKTAPIRRIFGHDHAVLCCRYHTGGDVILTGSMDGQARLWDMRSNSRKPLQTLGAAAGITDAVSCAALPRPDRGGRGARTRQRAGAPAAASRQTGRSRRAGGATSSVDAHWLSIGSLDGHVRTFDLRSGRCQVDDLHAPVTGLACSFDGQCLLASTLAKDAPLCLRLLDRSSGRCLWDTGTGPKRPPGLHRQYHLRPALSADDSLVLSGSEDGSLLAIDVVSGRTVRELQVPKPAGEASAWNRCISAVEAHPNPLLQQPIWLTAGYDGCCRIWEAR